MPERSPTWKSIMKSIGPDDYEEAELLRRLSGIEVRSTKRLAQLPSARPKNLTSSGATSEELTEREWVHKKLGYSPHTGRMGRARGRPRAESIPNPLPPPGTKLLSCLGDEYVVHGYASTPRQSETLTTILYTFNGDLIARSLPNLFAGRLSNGEPLVTWPEDPRKLKAGLPVPMKYQRAVGRDELVAKKGVRTATPLDLEHIAEAEAARQRGRQY